MDKLSLDDIFTDSIFDELDEQLPKRKVERSDPEFEKFQEIIDWIKAHDGKEPEKSRDMTERRLFSRLKGYREKPEMIKKLSEIDNLGLLDSNVILVEKTEKKPQSIDDILSDDSLFEENNKLNDLLDLSRYKRTINAADKISRRKHASHFERYEPLFKQVHTEIASGLRSLKPFSKEANAGEGNNVKVGNFYIDNGILLMVLRIYDEQGNDVQESRNRDLKVHTIYENGTENKAMTLLGFVSNLYDTKRNGRLVTESLNEVLETGQIFEEALYQTTGYIYVVKSLSDNPDISKYQNLYKIGFAGESVEKRIANAQNEATYLYAPVKIMATWQVQNFSARKLETALHHIFEDKQLQIEVPTITGGVEIPKEWYLVTLEEIEETVNKLVSDLLI